jgi:hypothetical protein
MVLLRCKNLSGQNQRKTIAGGKYFSFINSVTCLWRMNCACTLQPADTRAKAPSKVLRISRPARPCYFYFKSAGPVPKIATTHCSMAFLDEVNTAIRISWNYLIMTIVTFLYNALLFTFIVVHLLVGGIVSSLP